MQPDLERRARDMVKMLDSTCGIVLNNGVVMVRCKGGPNSYSDTPTPYNEDDLNNAIQLKLLEKEPLIISSSGAKGSTERDWYTARRPRRGDTKG